MEVTLTQLGSDLGLGFNMAKNRYICNQCSSEEFKYRNIDSYICSCGGNFLKQLPRLADHVQVNETVDKYRNVKHKQDQGTILEDRRLEHFWSKTVPEMVQSGVYSMETMLENGWVYYSEKGELVTRTSPPQKD